MASASLDAWRPRSFSSPADVSPVAFRSRTADCVAFEINTDDTVVPVYLDSVDQRRLRAYFHARLAELDSRMLTASSVELSEESLPGGWQVWYADESQAFQPKNSKARKLLGPNDDHINSKWHGRVLVLRLKRTGSLYTLDPSNMEEHLEKVGELRCRSHHADAYLR